jgi:predicted acyltransferase
MKRKLFGKFPLTEEPNASGRLLSLDALRGFDMFWIMSGEMVFHALAKATNAPVFNWMSGQIDRILLPGKVYRTIYDPEGILSTIPAIGSALLGVLTGQFLRMKKENWTKFRKSLLLAAAGVVLQVIGWIWGLVFPINKNMWTSSFVIYVGGLSLLFLFVFYLIIDVLRLRRWSMPFVWIGMNSILIYIASHGLINFKHTASYLFDGLIKYTPDAWHPVWAATGIVLVQLGLLYFLYRKKWFLKV